VGVRVGVAVLVGAFGAVCVGVCVGVFVGIAGVTMIFAGAVVTTGAIGCGLAGLASASDIPVSTKHPSISSFFVRIAPT